MCFCSFCVYGLITLHMYRAVIALGCVTKQLDYVPIARYKPPLSTGTEQQQQQYQKQWQ